MSRLPQEVKVLDEFHEFLSANGIPLRFGRGCKFDMPISGLADFLFADDGPEGKTEPAARWRALLAGTSRGDRDMVLYTLLAWYDSLMSVRNRRGKARPASATGRANTKRVAQSQAGPDATAGPLGALDGTPANVARKIVKLGR